jgi:hypothetical protein
MPRMRILGASLVVALSVGCGTEVPPPEPVARIDLRVAFGTGDVEPIGVAIAPDGARYVFDAALGLYNIDRATAIPVARLADLPAPLELQLPITDVVAIAPDVFAITAIGDGFLLDVGAMTMTQHFCYVPDGTPETERQRTDAIAYDAASDLIYAQPRSFDIGDNLLSSQVASYAGQSGDLLSWLFVPNDVDAGGAAFVPDVGLLLVQGTTIHRFEAIGTFDHELEPFLDLASYGVSRVEGLAHDPVNNTLTFIDADTDELIEIEL